MRLSSYGIQKLDVCPRQNLSRAVGCLLWVKKSDLGKKEGEPGRQGGENTYLATGVPLILGEDSLSV